MVDTLDTIGNTIGSWFSRRVADPRDVNKVFSGSVGAAMTDLGGNQSGLAVTEMHSLLVNFKTACIITGDSTIRELLLGTTTLYNANLKARALGSALHTVQDSFARGHTKREGDFKAVLRFHCYTGQDHEKHAKYDEEGGDNLDTHDTVSFSKLQGGIPAIRACTALINAFVDNAAKNRDYRADGDESVFHLFDQIWILGTPGSGVGPADTEI